MPLAAPPVAAATAASEALNFPAQNPCSVESSSHLVRCPRGSPSQDLGWPREVLVRPTQLACSVDDGTHRPNQACGRGFHLAKPRLANNFWTFRCTGKSTSYVNLYAMHPLGLFQPRECVGNIWTALYAPFSICKTKIRYKAYTYTRGVKLHQWIPVTDLLGNIGSMGMI